MASTKKEKFQMTQEEVDQLKKALQKDEFRKLLADYAKEISDPENKKRYEEEITRLERERGQDIKFLHPKPGFVIKAKDVETGKKLFLNLCHNDIVGLATAVPSSDAGKVGQKWSIPYSLTPPREDYDKEQRRCMVYDVVFHSSTYEKGEADPRFRQLLIDTALGGIQRQFNITINKKALRFPKMSYKGTPKATLVRRPHDEGPLPEAHKSPLPFPYPDPLTVDSQGREGRESNGGEGVERRSEAGSAEKSGEGGEGKSVEDGDKKSKGKKKRKKQKKSENEPNYTVVHRGEVELADFTNSRVSSAIKQPKELVVRVELPGVKTVGDVDLEVFERRVELVSQSPVYKLELDLHYSVNCDRTSAQFDKSTHVLTITLPVVPGTPPPTTLLPPITPPPPEGVGLLGDEELNISEDERGTAEVSAPPPKETCDKDPPTAGSAIPSSDTRSEGPLLPTTLRRCPPYRYRHDDKRVVFVLDVKSVNQGTVVTHFDDNWAQVTFSTAADGYSFHVQFDSTNKCLPEECSVDVTSDNVVVVLRKVEDGGTQWTSFTVGPTAADTSKKLFYTPHNVQQTTQELRDPWSRGDTAGSVEGATDVSCWTEEGAVMVEVTRNAKEGGKEDGGCSDGVSENDPSSLPHGDPTEVESQPVTPTLPNDDRAPTSLSDVSDTIVTVSPLSDTMSPNVNASASPEVNDKVSCDDSVKVSPTRVDDKVELCEREDPSPLSINSCQLSMANDYVFDLD